MVILRPAIVAAAMAAMFLVVAGGGGCNVVVVVAAGNVVVVIFYVVYFVQFSCWSRSRRCRSAPPALVHQWQARWGQAWRGRARTLPVRPARRLGLCLRQLRQAGRSSGSICRADRRAAGQQQ